MRSYTVRQHNYKGRSCVTLQMLLSEVESLNQLANKFNISRQQLLRSALRKGLPVVVANLERIANARSTSQATKEGGNENGN